MMLQQKTTVIDLNSLLSCGDILLSSIRRSTVNEERTNSFFANPRFYSKASIQSLCQSLLRQLSSQIFLMLRPISDNGLCSTNIPRKPKRCRNLLKSFGPETLSLWLPRKSFSEQFSQHQREKRLANISRLCKSSNHQSKATLCGRRLRRYIKKYRLCFGRYRDRSMLVAVSLGSTSQRQKCSKAPHTNGPERLDTHVYTHYKRCCARDHSLSNYASGAIGHICHGQRLHRFFNIIQFFKEQLLLCYLFVIRAKKNAVYYRKCSRPIDKSTGLRSDQTIKLTGTKTSELYPRPLRRISFRDEDQSRTFVFLTNNFQLDALTVCQLYKLRWQIELFFKWIKQHLRIKSFFGTSINAVKTQVWVAISVYVLVAIIKKELKLERSLHEILQILSILLFEKTSLKQALTGNYYNFKEQLNYNQLSLFDL